MGVAVLHPQDCLKQPFSHMKYPRNPSTCPNRQKKPVANRTRRSPPRNQATRSPPIAPPLPPPRVTIVPKGTAKKITNNNPLVGHVRILKRGEEIPKIAADQVAEIPKTVADPAAEIPKAVADPSVEIPKKTADLAVEKPDLGSTRRIGPDPGLIPSQIRLSGRKYKAAPFYAGPVTMTSPPPSDVPLPAFFTTKKSVSLFQAADATNDLIRILRLDIA